mmetsp:Transcript_4506/g.7626  ORF Transcript_4506/g.7626 Transcript_4506/m.7626 type:complete len:279 (+) Transcript_4506:141-977(+)
MLGRLSRCHWQRQRAAVFSTGQTRSAAQARPPGLQRPTVSQCRSSHKEPSLAPVQPSLALVDRGGEFAGHQLHQLQEWLECHGVDTKCYGSGSAKTVEDLLEEQFRKESVLTVCDQGRALRTVKVLSLHILNDQGKVLFEDEQILPDGRSRRRHVAVSEKLIGNECWRSAVDRAVHEELAMALPASYQVQVLDDTYQHMVEVSSSMSYPGLQTQYIFHRVNARLPGLPMRAFETREERPGGHLITRWTWKDVTDAGNLCGCVGSACKCGSQGSRDATT